MKTHRFTLFFILSSSLLTPFNAEFRESNRRILHQPLFPSTQAPPQSDPPPAPAPPNFPDPDQPFSHELPTIPPADQHAPPQPHSTPAAANSVAAPPAKTKKTAIAVSASILTIFFLSALALFTYRKIRKNRSDDSGNKLFNTNDADTESRIPGSTFLYIGTVEPTGRTLPEETRISSPYRKLNSGKISERYRPSPELQPLPPLTKPPPAPAIYSSDDESSFYTPQSSSKKSAYSYSKRTSPKSRLSVSSSPDTKAVIAPPPAPPPPPPPPAPPGKFVATKSYAAFPPFKQATVLQSKNLSPIKTPASEKRKEDKKEKNEIDDRDGLRPRLKPLHWDKVRATSERATVWDQLKSSSFQLNEDAMETLFGCNSANSVHKEGNKRLVTPGLEQEIRVLDPKKSQNIAILLRALNVTREEVSEALLDGNPDGLGAELLETLVKMAPTKEEEIKLKEYNGEISKLGSAERFLKGVLEIPFAFKRVEMMLYRANFDNEVNYLRKSFKILEEASQELKSSRLFLKLLEAVLKAGNRMNDGTNRGHATAFKLDTLLKLADVKGTDGKTTLLHFVVQEIIRSEGTNKKFRELGSQVGKELESVKKAAAMDSDVLSGYVSKLEVGLGRVESSLQHDRSAISGEFFDSMNNFLKVAILEIGGVKEEESKALTLVKEVTEYFHGDAAKEEAHPLRIFVIVRDFLGVLDNVCKDVGMMHERPAMGGGRSFRMPVSVSLPVHHRKNETNIYRSSDDDDDDDSV